jgi:hypothetical protein
VADFVIECDAGTERPDLALLWREGVGRTLINFAAGYSFAVKVGAMDLSATSFTKTTGITGSAGAEAVGTTPAVPNLVISWTAADRGALAAGTYRVEIRATTGGVDRDALTGTLVVRPVLP